jgi:transposase
MGRSYSQDFGDRIDGFVEKGHSRRAAARHFGVSESFAEKLLPGWRATDWVLNVRTLQ